MSMPDTTPDAVTAIEILPPKESGVVRISARTAFILLVFTLAFTALMAGVYQLTKPVLDATALDAKRRTIADVLPVEAYDNDMLTDAITLPPLPALGLPEPTQLFRARKAGEPVALVFESAASDGYSGEVRLIIAVRTDGRLEAVRVTAHKETPGLGDYIDPKKDKNKSRPWIGQFNQIGFSEVSQDKWRVKKDGGAFDQRTGATISARAVTKAAGRGLVWANDRATALYALPAAARYEEK